MTWLGDVQSAFSILGGLGAAVALVFLAGRLFQRMIRGEADIKLSPIQKLSVDVERLEETVKREIAELRGHLGTQYTEVVQRVNLDHAHIRDLLNWRAGWLEEAMKHFYPIGMIDRMAKESEQDRKDLHAEYEALRAEQEVLRTRCFIHHGGDAQLDRRKKP